MIRVNRFISSAGHSSRRKADQLIDEGRVRVNGEVLKDKGVLINPIKDEVQVDNEMIRPLLSKALIAFHKPRGVLSSMSGTNSLTAFTSAMPHSGLFHVGRLDRESEGLLILTNDGAFAQKLIHPKFEVEKEYIVSVKGMVSKSLVETLRRGVVLEDGPFKPDRVSKTGPDRLLLVITDGRNRVIRRAMENLDFEVTRLLRTRIGAIELGALRQGEWRYLKKHEKLNN